MIYSAMTPPVIDDVVSFSSILTPSISALYATMFRVAPNSPLDRVIPAMLREIFILHFNSNLRPVSGVWEDSLCTVHWLG
jgi:hypothetical protein